MTRSPECKQTGSTEDANILAAIVREKTTQEAPCNTRIWDGETPTTVVKPERQKMKTRPRESNETNNTASNEDAKESQTKASNFKETPANIISTTKRA